MFILSRFIKNLFRRISMFAEMEKIKKAKQQWLKAKQEKSTDQNKKYITASSEPVEILATPAELPDFDYFEDHISQNQTNLFAYCD